MENFLMFSGVPRSLTISRGANSCISPASAVGAQGKRLSDFAVSIIIRYGVSKRCFLHIIRFFLLCLLAVTACLSPGCCVWLPRTGTVHGTGYRVSVFPIAASVSQHPCRASDRFVAEPTWHFGSLILLISWLPRLFKTKDLCIMCARTLARGHL